MGVRRARHHRRPVAAATSASGAWVSHPPAAASVAPAGLTARRPRRLTSGRPWCWLQEHVREGSRSRRRDGRREERDEPRAVQLPQHAVLALQRSAGNRATLAALQRFWVKEGTDYRWEADESLKPHYVQTSETRSSWIPWRSASPVYVEKPGTSREMLG